MALRCTASTEARADGRKEGKSDRLLTGLQPAWTPHPTSSLPRIQRFSEGGDCGPQTHLRCLDETVERLFGPAWKPELRVRRIV